MNFSLLYRLMPVLLVLTIVLASCECFWKDYCRSIQIESKRAFKVGVVTSTYRIEFLSVENQNLSASKLCQGVRWMERQIYSLPGVFSQCVSLDVRISSYTAVSGASAQMSTCTDLQMKEMPCRCCKMQCWMAISKVTGWLGTHNIFL